MALCRIYLCTYRRPTLLPRALQSLINQTFQDWICELHNDDPTDLTPQALVQSVNDSRILLVNHETNLGPTQTLNLVFQKVDEPFVSLLEDDNWWEPTFLETMLSAMEQHPNVDVAWSNMQMWQEHEDESWTDLARTTFPFPVQESLKLFNWFHPYQILGSLHSHGAMLVRTTNIENYQVPLSIPVSIIEHTRERAYTYPILFVNQTLANFAVTRSTARSRNIAEWGAAQLLLVATFFKHVKLTDNALHDIWQSFRHQKPSNTTALLWTGLLYPECRYLLNQSIWQDWLLFVLRLLKRPVLNYKFLQQIKAYQELYEFLDVNTKKLVNSSVEISV
jgi:glycosyltransferase involved in cell wall biosynthesis